MTLIFLSLVFLSIRSNLLEYHYNVKTGRRVCQGYAMKESSTVCESCSKGCGKCESRGDRTVCTKCLGTYYLDDEGNCQKCGPHCLHCQDEETCTQCLKLDTAFGGYHLTKRGQCVPCPEMCKKCHPVKDEDSYGGTRLACDKCAPGSFLSSTYECIVCPFGCSKCDLMKRCLKCKSGFVKDGLDCIRNEGCSWYDSGMGCQGCENGYYLDNFRNCQKCLPGCMKCSSLEYCNECFGSHWLNYEDYKCYECPTSLVHCAFCEMENPNEPDTSPWRCSSCPKGSRTTYYKGRCMECPEGCNECEKDGGECRKKNLDFGECLKIPPVCTDCYSPDENPFYHRRRNLDHLAMCYELGGSKSRFSMMGSNLFILVTFLYLLLLH